MILILTSNSQGIIDVEACFPDPPSVINCRWGEWEYESCSVTCGGGSQTGVRRPVVQAQNGGRPCTGPALEERACNEMACPGIKCFKKADYNV